MKRFLDGLRVSALRPLKEIVRGISPLLIGSFVGWILISVGEGEFPSLLETPLDVSRWPVTHIGIVKDIQLFLILLISNFVVVLVNMLYYSGDLERAAIDFKGAYGRRSSMISWARIVNWLAFVVLLLWIVVIIFVAPDSDRDEDLSRFSALSEYNAILSLVIFLLFGIEDCLMWHSLGRAQKRSPLDPELFKNITASLAFARGSVLFIDIPAVLAAIGIYSFTQWALGLVHVSNGLTEHGAQVFNSVFGDFLFTTRQLDQLKVKMLVEHINASVALGVAAGGQVMQLALSQIVFCMLHIKTRLFDVT